MSKNEKKPKSTKVKTKSSYQQNKDSDDKTTSTNLFPNKKK